MTSAEGATQTAKNHFNLEIACGHIDPDGARVEATFNAATCISWTPQKIRRNDPNSIDIIHEHSAYGLSLVIAERLFRRCLMELRTRRYSVTPAQLQRVDTVERRSNAIRQSFFRTHGKLERRYWENPT